MTKARDWGTIFTLAPMMIRTSAMMISQGRMLRIIFHIVFFLSSPKF